MRSANGGRRRFAYRLALQLGFVNVDEMLERITSEQFAEWIAFYRCEPFGENWLQTSYVCAMINNVVATKQSDSVDLDFFMPSFAKEKKRAISVNQDEMEMMARFGK